MTGFCDEEEKPEGPVQLHMVPFVQNKLRTPPSQTGLLLDKFGTRPLFTVTLVVAEAVQVPTVTTRVYTPLMAVVEAAIVGF